MLKTTVAIAILIFLHISGQTRKIFSGSKASKKQVVLGVAYRWRLHTGKPCRTREDEQTDGGCG